ncbi:MAG: hypothetical protein Kow00129_03530 [Thermoleophilia bacterium]
MSKTCYNCGTENEESAVFCRDCGANLHRIDELKHTGIQGGTPQERVLFDNGYIQLTTAAVLIGMNTDAPDVIPLDTLYDVTVDGRCITLKVKDGDDQQCFLDDPTELADLIRDQMFRPRLSHSRQERPPEDEE